MLESIFRELILDHYRKPRNKGELEEPTVTVAMRNPLCGDVIELMLRIEDERIADLRFKGQGCSISQAAASVLHELVVGLSIPEALSRVDSFTEMIAGRSEPDEDAIGDGIAFAGVSKYPARVKCALLAWMAFKDATVQAGG